MLASGRTVGSVLDAAALEGEAEALAASAETLSVLVDRLFEAGMHREAIAVLAHALPDREAVGWAWVCARDATDPEASEEQLDSLDATKAWIQEPSDEVRRLAMERAEDAGLDTPAGFAGLAAFCCGDSMAPPDLPPAPPPEGIVGSIVSACIAIAASSADPEKIPDQFESFAKRGSELAKRIQLWTSAEADSTTPPSAS